MNHGSTHTSNEIDFQLFLLELTKLRYVYFNVWVWYGKWRQQVLVCVRLRWVCLCLLVPSQSVSCPFSDAYWLAYNNNSGGFCTHPASYVSPCASNTHLHFRLQKCSHAAYTYQRGTHNITDSIVLLRDIRPQWATQSTWLKMCLMWNFLFKCKLN